MADLDLNFVASDVLDARITFTRTSLATYYGSDGLLKYAGHNYLTQSEDVTTWTAQSGATVTANATTAPNSTLTADKANHVTAGTVIGGGFSKGVAPQGTFIASIYAKAGSKSWLRIGRATTGTAGQAYFNLATGVVGTFTANWTSSGIQDVGGGWYRCWVVGPTLTTVYFHVAETNTDTFCTSPGDIYLWGGQVEDVTTATTPSTYIPTTTAAVHTARFDYDPVSHAARGLLIEESRSNSFTQSQKFETVWVNTGATVAADQIAAPDGTTTADRITTSASPGWLHITFSLVTGTTYVQSIYAKKGTSDWIYMSAHDGVTSRPVWFNLATGTIGSYTLDAALLTVSMQDVGNGWYRCILTRVGTSAATNELCMFGICDADGSTAVTVGRTVYLWGAQLETGAFVTSYIPTASGAVTRAADVATMTGTNFSSWYNQTQGTFVAGFEMITPTGTRPILSADNGTATERILLYGSGTDPKVTVTDGGVVQADLDLGTL